MKRAGTQHRPFPVRRVEAVVLGASAGGIDALSAVPDGLPANWRIPMAVVLHLPESHESHLAEIFAQRLPIPVHEALDKMPLVDGCLYFAPPGYHLSIERGRRFSLSCEPPVLLPAPPTDVPLAPPADAYGSSVAGFLMTGANEDGAEGLLRIHRAGGLTAVQDPKEALVPTMPLAAIARHAPDHVLRLRDLRILLQLLEPAHAH